MKHSKLTDATRFYHWLYARCASDHYLRKSINPKDRTEFDFWWTVYNELDWKMYEWRKAMKAQR